VLYPFFASSSEVRQLATVLSQASGQEAHPDFTALTINCSAVGVQTLDILDSCSGSGTVVRTQDLSLKNTQAMPSDRHDLSENIKQYS
jgi:hypothetical protein